MRRCLAAVAMLCCAAGAAAAAETLPGPQEDFIPAPWRQISVQWKDSWEQTLAENLAPLRAAAAAAKGDNPAPATIAVLREIELYKAMIAHFPQRRDQHAQAYLAMAALCRRAGLPQAGAHYAWKVTREFGGQGDLVAQAYLELADCSAGIDADDAAWTKALDEALDLAQRGAIPRGHPAVPAVCEQVRRRICDEMRYDRFAGDLDRFTKLARTDERIYKTIAEMLNHFGESELAASLMPQKEDARWGAEAVRPTPGNLPPPPRNAELETRWEAFARGAQGVDASRPIDADQVQRILDLAAAGDAFAARGDVHYVSYRTLAQSVLDALPEANLAPLRALQNNAAGRLAMAIRSAEDPAAVARLTRLYPYAVGVHEALVDVGERALRAGHFTAATAAFRHVVRYSQDSTLRAAAQIGLCLALGAGRGSDEEARAILAAVPDAAEVPWRGATAPAGQIKASLLAGTSGGEPPRALSDLPRVPIALPADWPLMQRHREGPVRNFGLHAPWPVTRIERVGAAFFVSGPGRLARFQAGSAAPLWQVRASAAAAPAEAQPPSQYMQHPWRDVYCRPVGSPAAGSSAVAEDGQAVYRLSGGGAVSAVDSRTGKDLWSTATDPQWRGLAAMNYPAAADGRVYVLAVPAAESDRAAAKPMASKGPWHLVCLDGRSGGIVWKTPLSWSDSGELDLARDGTAVTIDADSVYCCPGMGLVARCDARDGRLMWVRGYPSAVGNVAMADALVYSREGTSPIRADGRLFVAPRDSSGVTALQADTGELLWSVAMAPSDRMLGVSGGSLVTLSGQWVAALDVATGRPLWQRRFAQGAPVQGALSGANVIVLENRRLHLLSARTGKTLEEKTLDGDRDAQYAFLADGALAELLPPRVAQIAPGAVLAAPLALPLAKAAYIGADEPSLVVSPKGDEAGFCILSGRRLLRVMTQPQLTIAWQRTLALRPLAAHIVGGRVLLSGDRRLAALDRSDGADQWTLSVPLVPYDVGGNDSLVTALPGSYGAARLAAIDPAAGKLLWTRGLVEAARFRGGIYRVELGRGAGAARTVSVVLRTLFDNGWQGGRVELNPAGGAVTTIVPFAPPPQEGIWFSGRGLVNAGADPAVRIAAGAAPGRAVYELPKPDMAGVHEILACRASGQRMIVVSGLAARQRQQGRVYVDVFDSVTRRHLGRQTLEGLAYCTGGQSGYDTHAEILDRAVVVTDAGGVHVFTAAK
ncbi:MAG: PQQ-binding-like beta-propeller repeat protein [Planctomycetaceae bacterium]|nr:PQQ-binding-like beta-propeller repeat protein [Planctomycetaceae bacterium]